MERGEEGVVVVAVVVGVVIVGAENLSPSLNSFPLSNCYNHLTKDKNLKLDSKIRSHTAATRYRQGQMGKSE